jgi:hypothetical protein
MPTRLPCAARNVRQIDEAMEGEAIDRCSDAQHFTVGRAIGPAAAVGSIFQHMRRLAPAAFLLTRALVFISAAAALLLLLLLPTVALGAAPAAEGAPAPSNDALAHAQPVQTLPATLSGTTVAATTEASEPGSQCGGATNSVWYSVRLPAAHRLGIDLTASGALDASIEVFHAVRSQLDPVVCEETEAQGKTSLSFEASKNGLYDIRVAARQNSQLAAFRVEVFLPTPAVEPPGPPLPGAGISGQVDRVQNINAAYSFTMRSGVSYLVNLANQTHGGCVSGALFAPGTASFGAEEGEQTSAVMSISCGGYRLFTPGPGEGGRYSFEVTPRLSTAGVQRFHLQVAPAGPAETAPGVPLGNYARLHGRLNGNGIQVLRLYRMEVTSHSNLTLTLNAPSSAKFSLQLRNKSGYPIECACEGSGGESLQHQLQPGTYYAVVSERRHSAGSFVITRESRTITATSISFSQGHVGAGQGVAIDVRVSPAASGPVRIDIERLDPVFGWQFFSDQTLQASAGSAALAFTPPNVGQWRAEASFLGSTFSSPSSVGFTYLLAS